MTSSPTIGAPATSLSPAREKSISMTAATDSSQTPESKPDGDGHDDGVGNGNTRLTATQRTVTPTSGRAPNRGSENAGARRPRAKTSRRRQTPPANDKSKASDASPRCS